MLRTKKYSLTEEHRAQLEPWARKWIANAMNTKPMDEADREAMRAAVKGLYEAAGLMPPPPLRIVFVASPFVMRIAGGFAAALWHLRRDAPAATDDATRAATRAATYDATRAATYDAASQSGEECFYFPANIVYLAKRILGPNYYFGLCCAQCAYRMWQGGNQWSAWASYLSFFRHVAQLPIDYSKWDHWEKATIHGGPRIMHAEFCMVSDRPEVLLVDEQNRPHCAEGPFCRWRDGSALYSWHGVRVPAKYYMREHSAREILAESNAEVRRAMIERYDELKGNGEFIQACGAKLIDSDVQPMRPGEPDSINELLAIELPGDPEGQMVYVKMVDPSTGRVYMNRVHPELRPLLGNDENGRPRLGKPQKMTVRNALASTHGLRGEQYVLQQES